MSGQASRLEHRALRVRRLLAGHIDAQLQPGATRQPHLGAQPKQMSRLDLLDSPEVDGVATPQPRGITPPATEADTAEDPVEPSARLPGERPGVPTVFSAHSLDDPPQVDSRRGDARNTLVDVQRAAGPLRIARQRVGRRAGQTGVGPTCADVAVTDVREREAYRIVEP